MLTLGVGLLAGFLAVLIMLPRPDFADRTGEQRTRVTHEWPGNVRADQEVRVRVGFETGTLAPGPNVTFYLNLAETEGIRYRGARPHPMSDVTEGAERVITVPADARALRSGYYAELYFVPTQVGPYRLRVRYRIGESGPAEFLASGEVLPQLPPPSQGPRLWE